MPKTDSIKDMRDRAGKWPKGAKYVTGSWAGDQILQYRLKELKAAEKTALEAEQSSLGRALRDLKEKRLVLTRKS